MSTEEVAVEETLINLDGVYRESKIQQILDDLDRELVGLVPVKTRIREIASLLLISRLREQSGLSTEGPTLHMCFTGRPGTGKTTVAIRMGKILHHLHYVRKGHLVVATRDDLVGQYVGHTAPKTKEIVKKAMGGVLFIDEAYYLYRPDNERDYGQEAIEMLLQVMENQRDDLVVILAGYKERMDIFFQSNPGFRSRIAQPYRVSGLHARRADGDRRADLAPADVLVRRGITECVRRVLNAAGPAAVLRQRAQRPQRHRPRQAAPGWPTGPPGRRGPARGAGTNRR